MTLQEWTDEVSAALALESSTDIDLMLEIAREAAHAIERPAAPLTTFLVGLAAGRAGGTEADVRAAAETVMGLVAAHREQNLGR